MEKPYCKDNTDVFFLKTYREYKEISLTILSLY
jgi:hypothetical protein